MYAVIETGGKQYQVKEGDEIFVEKLDTESGEDDNVAIKFDKVVMVGGESVRVGNPYVEGAVVTASLVKNGKAKKITVFTYKPKKGYKRKWGIVNRTVKSK